MVLDLGTRDDNNELLNFDDEDQREIIREHVKTHKPLMIIGSHVQVVAKKIGAEKVKMLSQEDAVDLRQRNKEHQQFLAEIYREQAKGERYYAHEVIESDVVCGRMDSSIKEVADDNIKSKVNLGGWVNGSGERGSIDMITNNVGVQKRLSAVKGIIERRFEGGDEGENRYGREREVKRRSLRWSDSGGREIGG